MTAPGTGYSTMVTLQKLNTVYMYMYTGKIELGGAAIFLILGADCHQSSAIPPWPCVPRSRARLRLTQQSLKRAGHEGKLCLKVEQRHPPCLSKVLAGLGVIGVTGYITDL